MACVSIMTLSFLASILFKHLKGERPDDVSLETLRQLAGEYAEPSVPAEVPTDTLAEVPQEEPETKAKKVRKIKSKVEHAILRPVDMDAEPLIPQCEIQEGYCLARKEGEVISGTEGAKVYREKQCPKKAQKGGTMCKVCEKMEENHKANPKDKKWLGRMGEALPEHAHMVGSVWFREKYPEGLPTEEHVEPVEESVVSSEGVKEILWIPLMHDGFAMMRNVKTRNVYKADTEKEGEDMILWSEYVGKWMDGEVDYHAEEDEE